jgi:hypothetical protein
MLSCHHKKLADHSATFANVFLHKFGASDAYKLAVGMMRHRAGEQGFPSPRWSIEEYAFRLCNTQGLEELGVLHRQFDHFLYFLDLLVEATDHLVRTVWNLFNHHKRNEGVNLVGENLVNGVRVASKSDTECRLEVCNV